ncbi:MAG: hypothetical protein GDA52_09330 [Rhodobacteraceae bacterium]|nr:hypothetical protein [Paracoccaceae bacterium]
MSLKTIFALASLVLFLAVELWRQHTLRTAAGNLPREEQQKLSPGLRPQPYQRREGTVNDYARLYDRVRLIQFVTIALCLAAIALIVFKA